MRKGEDIITFIDESLYLSYAKSTWWIDLGSTIHVANSLQDSILGGPYKEEKDTIKWQMESKLK